MTRTDQGMYGPGTCLLTAEGSGPSLATPCPCPRPGLRGPSCMMKGQDRNCVSRTAASPSQQARGLAEPTVLPSVLGTRMHVPPPRLNF